MPKKPPGREDENPTSPEKIHLEDFKIWIFRGQKRYIRTSDFRGNSCQVSILTPKEETNCLLPFSLRSSAKTFRRVS
jgi:hypothetical protein